MLWLGYVYSKNSWFSLLFDLAQLSLISLDLFVMDINFLLMNSLFPLQQWSKCFLLN